MLIDAIDQYGVYSDKNLKDIICELENGFTVRDETDFFSGLVNFSDNKAAPCHGWFKFREGYSHTLIKELLNRSGITREEYVLDPFCGCGTTIVEAAYNGYSGIGIDINPLSAFVSRIKCRNYTDEEIETLKNALPGIFQDMRGANMSREYRQKYGEVEKFFNEHNFERLLSIRQTLDAHKEVLGIRLYELLLCAYLCIIEEVSDRKRDGNGLRMQVTRVTDVEAFYRQKTEEMIEDVEKYRMPADLTLILECGDAMKLSEIVERYSDSMDKDLGAIIYSPPYANSFDYFESYKMEIILADYASDKKGIGDYRQQAVESFIGRADRRHETRDFIEWMSREIESAIPEKESRTGKRDARTRKVPGMIRGYFSDMEKVIEESAAVLRAGKKCYIVVDQSAYLGKIVPTDLFLGAIAREHGFHVNEIIVCRNAKTSGQQLQLYPYLNTSLRESIVVLEKM